MFGDRALIMAVRHRKYAAMEKLLVLPDIDVNATDAHGRTALIWAVLNRDIGCIQTLLEHGASINRAAKCKKTACMFAAALDQDEPISGGKHTGMAPVVDILRLLLNRAARRSPGSTEWTTRQRERLKECMVRRDEFGWCALHLAAKTNLLAQCKALSIDAPINIMTNSGSHALHIAAWNGREATVLYLFQGPDGRQWQPALRSNLMLPSGHTPLDLAIIKNHFVCVDLMLAAPHNLTCHAHVCVQPPCPHAAAADTESSETRVSLQELLHTLILHGKFQPVQGLLQFDQNELQIDNVLVNITRQIKYRCTCTFSFTNYTHPIRQYMYRCHDCTEQKRKEKKLNKDENVEPVLVCLVCKDECHKGHRLTLEVDPSRDGDIAHYCQCTKATCKALSRMGKCDGLCY